MADKVTLTLAHPIGGEVSCARLGIPVQEYQLGTELELTPESARTLIAAGYAAGVDPENPEQVRAALGASRGADGAPAGDGAGAVPAGGNPADTASADTDPRQRRSEPAPVTAQPGTAQPGPAQPTAK